MSCSRRQILLAGLSFLVAGCSTTQTGSTLRPRTQWPETAARPRPSRSTPVESPYRPAPAAPVARPATAAPADSLNAIARSRWTTAGHVRGRVNPMNGVTRITVHHEGWTNFFDTAEAACASRIEQIRRVHVNDRGWGDIGYHYIIDPAGRVWQGRSLSHQGAHVSGHNEHNIGIMLIGNFDRQTPTAAQLNRLVASLRSLMQTHRVPAHRVYTHQELSPSACPGRNLQPRMVTLRQGGHLA